MRSFFNKDEALGLPEGSVRAILAILLVVPVAIISLKSNVMFTGDQVIGIVGMVLTAYFVKSAGERPESGGS